MVNIHDNLFIVREKDGSATLPVKRKESATIEELSTVRPPRIFSCRRSAASAIRWWKAGIAYRYETPKVGIHSIHIRDRDKVELEIVPVILMEDD